MVDQLPILDLSDALDRVDGDRELYLELVEMFLGDWPGNLAALRESLAKSDTKALSEGAHAAKGVLGNISAKRAHSAAYALEKAAKASDLVTCQTALATLSVEVESFRSAYAEVKAAR